MTREPRSTVSAMATGRKVWLRTMKLPSPWNLSFSASYDVLNFVTIQKTMTAVEEMKKIFISVL